jgi:hypothetical protein
MDVVERLAYLVDERLREVRGGGTDVDRLRRTDV